mmetsp:Transcript_19528/g.77830  ORF Transcript_19528/g.77830 Transcript_19528/m.77830 type:complete len:86 (-) Transcript_19528:248-505(-)
MPMEQRIRIKAKGLEPKAFWKRAKAFHPLRRNQKECISKYAVSTRLKIIKRGIQRIIGQLLLEQLVPSSFRLCLRPRRTEVAIRS